MTKEPKGKLIEIDNSLLNDNIFLDYEDNRINFKKGCLLNTQIIYQNEYIQVGMISDLKRSGNKQFLKISNYIRNIHS